jgi:stage IV sporulation protein FB
VKVHPLFWLIAGMGIVAGYFKEVLIIFFIVTVHEMGHYSAARYFKWKVKKIKLLPFGGVAEIDEYGNRPMKEELIILLSGPAQHVWMIALSFLFCKIGLLSSSLFELFLFHNAVIFIFNLLPIWPLDGGKILFLLFSYFKPYKRALLYALISSSIFLLIFSLTTLIAYPMQLNVWVIVLFLIFSNVEQYKQRSFVHLRFLMERYYETKRKYPKSKGFTIHENTKITDVFANFYRDVFHFYFLHNGKQIDERRLLRAFFSEKRTNCTIRDLFL